jgi:hypothetical protein
MLQNEQLLDFVEASSFLPARNGKRIHTSTIWRWCRDGIMLRSGERVRLEYRRLGGRMVTSRQALERFGHALAEADCDLPKNRPKRSSRKRNSTSRERARRDRAVNNKLARDGF